nr:MAG TPA: hypothetical protein [Caudoviricetes sp.]
MKFLLFYKNSSIKTAQKWAVFLCLWRFLHG